MVDFAGFFLLAFYPVFRELWCDYGVIMAASGKIMVNGNFH